MCNGEDHGIVAASGRLASFDFQPIFPACLDRTDPRIPDFDGGIILMKAANNVDYLRIAQIRAIFFEA